MKRILFTVYSYGFAVIYKCLFFQQSCTYNTNHSVIYLNLISFMEKCMGEETLKLPRSVIRYCLWRWIDGLVAQ